jgi:LruC domain-containing protein
MATQVLITSLALSFTGACTREDENLQWLLTVLDPAADIQPSEPETVPFEMKVDDVTGTTDFLFENMTTYPVRVTVMDGVDSAQNTLIQVLEVVSGGERVVFRATTGVEGNVTGSFTIENRAEPGVILQVTYMGVTYRYDILLTSVRELNRYINVSTVTVSVPVPVSDSDGDGIPDDIDHYPDDATRATVIKIPADGYYTIAYEDLYPTPGDADFNDYVVRVQSEEDLDAQGRVVRMRSNFTHVAKGAGYNHTLHLKLPAAGEYTLTRTASDGTVVLDQTATLAALTGIEILPASNTTLAQSNTAPGQTFVTGMTALVETRFAEPVDRLLFKSFPYDIYLYVKNTKKEIHFAGHALATDGTDPYIDSNGFPWALLVPGDWDWPLERKNIHQAYPLFQSWYESTGQQAADWYSTVELNLVFAK